MEDPTARKKSRRFLVRILVVTAAVLLVVVAGLVYLSVSRYHGPSYEVASFAALRKELASDPMILLPDENLLPSWSHGSVRLSDRLDPSSKSGYALSAQGDGLQVGVSCRSMVGLDADSVRDLNDLRKTLHSVDYRGITITDRSSDGVHRIWLVVFNHYFELDCIPADESATSRLDAIAKNLVDQATGG